MASDFAFVTNDWMPPAPDAEVESDADDNDNSFY